MTTISKDNPNENISFGKYTYYGDVKVFAYDKNVKLKVGKFCSIANGVKFLLGGKHFKEWVTTYPFYDKWIQGQYPTLPKAKELDEITSNDTIIGNEVWIGQDATILSGVRVGNGAVIGAGSVVRPVLYDVYGNRHTSIPAYAIVMGNPAIITELRFDVSVIERLQEIAWWDFEESKIQEAMSLLCSDNMKEFIEKYQVKL